MRTFYALFVILCFVYIANAQHDHNSGKTTNKMNIESDSSNVLTEKFQKLAEIWRQAYNSKNSANLSPLYADNAQYISAHVNGYIADGHDAVIKNFQRGMDSGGYLDSVEILSINFSCNLATVVSRYRGLAGGQKVDGRNLLVWKRINDKWLIVTHMTVVKD
jgi:ketosteroid isomerase-like protein